MSSPTGSTMSPTRATGLQAAPLLRPRKLPARFRAPLARRSSAPETFTLFVARDRLCPVAADLDALVLADHLAAVALDRDRLVVRDRLDVIAFHRHAAVAVDADRRAGPDDLDPVVRDAQRELTVRARERACERLAVRSVLPAADVRSRAGRVRDRCAPCRAMRVAGRQLGHGRADAVLALLVPGDLRLERRAVAEQRRARARRVDQPDRADSVEPAGGVHPAAVGDRRVRDPGGAQQHHRSHEHQDALPARMRDPHVISSP